MSGADKEAEDHCTDLKGNRSKLTFELLPYIAGRVKRLIEENEQLLDKLKRRSAISERLFCIYFLLCLNIDFSTLSFIKSAQEEHMPNFQHLDVKMLRRMVAVAKSCLETKGKQHNNRLWTIGQERFSFNKCNEILKEFDEICAVAEWLEGGNERSSE